MELSRRDAIKAGALGLGGLGLAAITGLPALGPGLQLPGAGAASPPPAPQIIKSVNGVLQGQLRVSTDPAWVAGDPATGTLTYNGLYPGPVLWAKPGDRVLLDVINDSPQMINTHFHGFHVTPNGTGDNVFAHVMPGETFHHDFVIPADHDGGLYWYHPHMHGLVDKQLYGGLSGLFVIEGGAAALPTLADKTHVLMALKNGYITGTGPSRALAPEPAAAQQIHTINGQLQPTYQIASGETQLWRIANVGNDPYYRISLDGHPFTVVAEDGALLWDTYTATELLLPPGKRFEVAVTGVATPGSYAFRQLGYTQGPFGQWPAAVLANLTVTAPAIVPAVPAVIPFHPRTRDDLVNATIAAHRTIVMSESFDASTNTPAFYLNGVLFQNITAADIAQVTLGTTEEWVLRNDPSVSAGGAPEDHPFHIHLNPMVVVGQGTWDPATGTATTYQPVDPKGTVDTINVKANEYVVVRIHFADFAGKSVYHCHITFHEDMGMMGIFQVNEPPAPPPPPAPPIPAQPIVVRPTFTG